DGSAEVLNWSGGRPGSLGAGFLLKPRDPEVQRANFWLRNVFTTYDAETISQSGGYYAAGLFLRVPPTIKQLDYRQGPTQRLFRGTDRAPCLGQGQVPCPAGAGFEMMISRGEWDDPSATAVGYDAADFYGDHAIQRAGDYVIYKKQRLVCGGNSDCAASAGAVYFERYNQYLIGGGASINRGELETGFGNFSVEPYDSRVTRWAGGASDDGVASNIYAYLLNDLTGTFGGNQVARFDRHLAHLKKTGTPEYVVLYDDVAVRRPTSLRFFTHYAQNGGENEGATECAGAGCGALDAGRQVLSSTADRSAAVATHFLAPEGAATYVAVDAPDGKFLIAETSYDTSFRVTACAGQGQCAADASAYEMMTVHRIRAGAPEPVKAFLLSPGPEWTGAELDGKAILFARHGQLRTQVPEFGIDHNGEVAVLVAGLAPGVYRFTHNGEPVALCDNIPVAAADNTAYCDNVAAGRIAVQAVSLAADGTEADPARRRPTPGAAAARVPKPAPAPATAPPTPTAAVEAAGGEAWEAREIEIVVREGAVQPQLWPFAEPVLQLRLEGLEGKVWLDGQQLEAELLPLPTGVYRGRIVAVLANGEERTVPVRITATTTILRRASPQPVSAKKAPR
ncbi:MAG: hypothetical protein OEV97_15450, partial [Betaproteobacteria bacterium]|nr:hypothetical protein [Betaproteobacteria bacterium]